MFGVDCNGPDHADTISGEDKVDPYRLIALINGDAAPDGGIGQVL